MSAPRYGMVHLACPPPSRATLLSFPAWRATKESTIHQNVRTSSWTLTAIDRLYLYSPKCSLLCAMVVFIVHGCNLSRRGCQKYYICVVPNDASAEQTEMIKGKILLSTSAIQICQSNHLAYKCTSAIQILFPNCILWTMDMDARRRRCTASEVEHPQVPSVSGPKAFPVNECFIAIQFFHCAGS